MTTSENRGPDLSFSSSSEIKSFVRSQLGHPGHTGGDGLQAGESSYYRKTFSGRYTTLDGRDVASGTSFFR